MDKPFKTFDEQLEILKSRGITVDNPDILKREGYYSVINGYKEPFLSNPTEKYDEYISGTKLSDIVAVFKFDRSLRMCLFKYTTQAESILKTLTAYNFEKYAQGSTVSNSFLDESFFQIKTDKDIKDFNKLRSILIDITEMKGVFSKKSYLQHYVTNCERMPLWVVVNALDFGKTLMFVRLLRQDIQNSIAKDFSLLYEKEYGERVNLSFRGRKNGKLLPAYSAIRDLRNYCAHDERLYCMDFSRDRGRKISVIDVINPMKYMLEKEQYDLMCREIDELLTVLSNTISRRSFKRVKSQIGL